MSTFRDILAVAGLAIVVGSIATQSLWIAGVVAGTAMLGASLWWSRAVARARLLKQDERGP